MSSFKKRKKEILVSPKQSAWEVTKINHQNDQFAITEESITDWEATNMAFRETNHARPI